MRKIDNTKCKLCMECVKNCPADAIYLDMHSNSLHLNTYECINCGMCEDCKNGAVICD